MRGSCILSLLDILYAPKIRRNLVFVLVLLELGYNLTGHLVNYFIVLDTILDGSSYNNSYFSYVISSSNNEIDAITWHARLGHIG